MAMRIFVAGASGIIGRSLIPLLCDGGHLVTGTTRTMEGKTRLEALGIRAVVVDMFDGETLVQVVAAAEPDVIIHQLTDLSSGINPAQPEEALKRNARLRHEGTANLVKAARSSAVKRMIAQNQQDLERPHTSEEQLMLIQTHQHLKQLERELLHQAGTVIIK